MWERGSIETTAFGHIGAALLLSSPALAIEIGIGGGVSIGIGGGGVGVSIGNGSTDPPADSPPVVVEPPAVADPGQAVFALPVALSPRPLCKGADSDHCDADAPDGNAFDSLTPQFVPTAIIAACREGIIMAAKAYDPVQVDVVGAGSVQWLEEGGRIAPLVVRIVYDRQGGYETREARVSCYVDALGNAVSLT